ARATGNLVSDTQPCRSREGGSRAADPRPGGLCCEHPAGPGGAAYAADCVLGRDFRCRPPGLRHCACRSDPARLPYRDSRGNSRPPRQRSRSRSAPARPDPQGDPVSASGAPSAEIARHWARRAATIPAVGCAFVLVVALLPVALPVAVVYDTLRGTRFIAARSLLLLAWFLTCEVWGLAATGLLFLGQATIARHDRLRADRWFYALESLWSGALFHGAERIFGFRVVLEPGSDGGMGPLIVFARHASMGDVLLPMLLLAPRGLRMRYVMKQELRLDPCLDVVGHRVPNTFVRRNSGDAAPEIAAVVRLLNGLSARDAVVIFPEGT